MQSRSLRPLVIAAALYAAAAGTASRFSVAQQRPYDLAAIPSSVAARWASFGHPTLVANLWWLRTVQYMGDEHAEARGWDKLYAATDLITDLDPRHGYVYQVTGIMLGSAGRVTESDALFEKGHRNVPDRYTLPFQRAVNAFLYEGDYLAAARWFTEASRTPGAPALRMKAYAAAMLVKSDAHDQARALLQESLAGAEDDDTRRRIEQQLAQVDFERAATTVEQAALVYFGRHGKPPVPLEAIVYDGILPFLPPEPFGGSWFLDPEGRVRSTAHAYRYDRPLSSAERTEKLEAAQKTAREQAHALEKSPR